MKKIIPLCVLLIISLIGCKESPKGKISPQAIKDSSLSLRDSLLGEWGGLGESRPVWDIRKDSIYYFQKSTAYPYKIINRDLVIFFPNNNHSFELRSIKVEHDTLLYVDAGVGMLVKAYRFKR